MMAYALLVGVALKLVPALFLGLVIELHHSGVFCQREHPPGVDNPTLFELYAVFVVEVLPVPPLVLKSEEIELVLMLQVVPKSLFLLFLAPVAHQFYVFALQVANVFNEVVVVAEYLPLLQKPFVFGQHVLLISLNRLKAGSVGA